MAFRLTMSKDLGMKRGRLAGSFVLASKQQTSEFYRSIVRGLRAWAQPPPETTDSGGRVSRRLARAAAILR